MVKICPVVFHDKNLQIRKRDVIHIQMQYEQVCIRRIVTQSCYRKTGNGGGVPGLLGFHDIVPVPVFLSVIEIFVGSIFPTHTCVVICLCKSVAAFRPKYSVFADIKTRRSAARSSVSNLYCLLIIFRSGAATHMLSTAYKILTRLTTNITVNGRVVTIAGVSPSAGDTSLG